MSDEKKQEAIPPIVQKDRALTSCSSVLTEILQNYAFALTPDALQRVKDARNAADAAELSDKEGG